MSLKKYQDLVAEFHARHGSPLDVPIDPHDELYLFSAAIQGISRQCLKMFRATSKAAYLRLHLILEETSELAEAIDQNNPVEFIDAYGDLLYVVLGTGATYGITRVDEIFAEIHRSNMTKTASDDPRVQSKGPDYEPPNLEHLA